MCSHAYVSLPFISSKESYALGYIGITCSIAITTSIARISGSITAVSGVAITVAAAIVASAWDALHISCAHTSAH